MPDGLRAAAPARPPRHRPRRRCRRQRQGDDIDIDAAVEARVDALAGVARTTTTSTSRACGAGATWPSSSCSTSPARPASPAPAGRRCTSTSARRRPRSTAALHDLGDRVALYAFNSRGRQAVQLLRVKAFDDHLDGDVAPAPRRARPRRVHAARRRHPPRHRDPRGAGGTPRRLLVVLSDGFAYDHGYEGRYGEADARRALVEARRRGVGCLCLSVGADAEPAALRRVFGTAAHATVPRTEQLPGVDRAAVPRRAALGGGPAARVPAQGTDAASGSSSRGGRDDRSGTPVLRARSVTRSRSSRRRSARACRWCSRARPAAARPGSSRPWPTTSTARSSPSSCHDDLTTADLVGRYLLEGGDTRWVDGPLTRAVREGAICYLDEVVEARQDTTVVLHPLADHRRQLPIDRLGVVLDAAPGFCLVVSYNPGYQSVLKDLKDSTRQRMVAIELDFPPPDVEEKIVSHEAGVDHEQAAQLVQLGPGDPPARDRRAPRGGVDPCAHRRGAAVASTGSRWRRRPGPRSPARSPTTPSSAPGCAR